MVALIDNCKIIGAASGSTFEVETNTAAGRVVVRQDDLEFLGAYGLVPGTGNVPLAIAPTGSNAYYVFRWTDAGSLCLIKNIKLSLTYDDSTAAQSGVVSLKIHKIILSDTFSNSFVSTNNQPYRLHGQQPHSRIITSAFSIVDSTSGTTSSGNTLIDTQPFVAMSMSHPATDGFKIVTPSVYLYDSRTDYPLIVGLGTGLQFSGTFADTTGNASYTVNINITWEEYDFPAYGALKTQLAYRG